MVRGRKTSLQTPKKADFAVRAAIHNRFDIEVIDSRTGKVRQRAQAENVICDQLWTRLFNATASNRAWNAYIHYGTGTGTPAAADTSLFTFYAAVEATGAIYDNNSAKTGYVSLRQQIQLDETTAVGETITEVGIGYGSTTSTLCTHAMLQDMNGNPTSILKSSTDIINIYATVFVHFDDSYSGGIKLRTYPPSTTDNAAALMLFLLGKTTSFLMTGYYYNGSQFAGLAAVYTTIAGTISVDAATKTFTISHSRLAAGDGNTLLGGIYAIRVYNSILLLTNEAWFPGSTITGEAIGTGDGTIKDFKTAFGFVQSPIIYVDGIEQTSGVTVDTGLPRNAYTEFSRFFISYHPNGLPTNDIGGPGLNNQDITPGSEYYLYNPFYSQVGIVQFYAQYIEVAVSNDFENWTVIKEGGTTETVTVPETYRKYKYWRITNPHTTNGRCKDLLTDQSDYNIHFDTAPASGAVITADYTSKTIAKDANHVFDFSCTVTVGAYSAS